ncbi:MAG: MBL fold metallo-hydrolase [Eubacteriales bacterium]|nr:MBL fold metallo-hydrolase [Eubacteriales bacterium]
MKLTILGTGNAAVTEVYNTCFAFSDGDRHFLVDTGGGNQILKRLKDADIPLSELHDIFITHEHIDHLLGLIWLIRMVGQKMNQGSYEGNLNIYCHEDLIPVIQTITGLTIQKKVCKHIGERILLHGVTSGESREIIGCKVTFFDIESTKAKQYGFTIEFSNGKKLACAGDEPYNPVNEPYIAGNDWLMHEAFCLYGEAEEFKPYEKHHSTVKEACETAGKLRVPNLILYHTEDKNIRNRKRLYTEEGRQYYGGNLYVPDDMESFEI